MSKKTWTKWLAIALAGVLIGAGVGYFAARSLLGIVVGAAIGGVIVGLPQPLWEFIMSFF